MLFEIGPRYVFIGSSSEGLDIANVVHDGLERPSASDSRLCDATMWEDIFRPGDFVLEKLLTQSETYDYAILIITPDDVTTSRNKTSPCPRDNLNFEMGLFMARLGRKFCIVVRPKEIAIKLPSDICGLCCVMYNHKKFVEKTDDLRPQINQIRKYIEDNGYRSRRQEFLQSWGYGAKQRLFAGSVAAAKLEPYANGQYGLLMGCFGGEAKDRAFVTERFSLSEIWPIPRARDIPSEINLVVDCSSFSDQLKVGDSVIGILFLVRGSFSLEKITNMKAIVDRGGMILDGKGNAVQKVIRRR